MALHFVRFCQLVSRVLVRWMAGSTPAAEEIAATSAAGRVSWPLTINVPSACRRRVVTRTQVRMLSRIDAHAGVQALRCRRWPGHIIGNQPLATSAVELERTHVRGDPVGQRLRPPARELPEPQVVVPVHERVPAPTLLGASKPHLDLTDRYLRLVERIRHISRDRRGAAKKPVPGATIMPSPPCGQREIALGTHGMQELPQRRLH